MSKKVIKFRPLRDEERKRYVPYCDFIFHQGIPKHPEICEERHCKYYNRLYLERRYGQKPKIDELRAKEGLPSLTSN